MIAYNFIEFNKTKTMRLFWSMLIVVLSSLICFLLVKYSIDWATISKSELNKLRDAQFRAISDEIHEKIIRNKRQE